MIAPRGPQLMPMLRYVGLPLLGLVGYDLVVILPYMVLHWQWVSMQHIPLSLFGSAIGIVVAFRNQSSYARWWEARTLWGAIVNNTRSWGRQVMTSMSPMDAGERDELKAMQKRMMYHQIAFVHSLRQHLRGLEPWEELGPLLTTYELSSLREEKNVPLALQKGMGEMLRECQVRGWIDSVHWRALDESLNDLADAQGGAERIKNTPMPKQFDYFPRMFIYIYCFLLPLGLVANLGWYTPLGSTLVGFIFLTLDEIGRDLENPFDNTIFDVPLTAITTTIETNLRQLLGETALPDPAKPVHGVLW